MFGNPLSSEALEVSVVSILRTWASPVMTGFSVCKRRRAKLQTAGLMTCTFFIVEIIQLGGPTSTSEFIPTIQAYG